MPRPRLCRRVSTQPDITYFKPAGIRITEIDEITLTVEEYEAIKLKDLLGLEQEKCARKMQISQPTFHRLIQSARRKTADALVNGKAIRIKGGNFKLAKPGNNGLAKGRNPEGNCICPKCGHSEPKKRGVPCASKNCPQCGTKIIRE